MVTASRGGTGVDFHSTGHVSRGTLAKNHTKRVGTLKLKKKTYQAGKIYSFNQRGEIQ